MVGKLVNLRGVGAALMAVGAALLLFAAGLAAYAQYERLGFEQERPHIERRLAAGEDPFGEPIGAQQPRVPAPSVTPTGSPSSPPSATATSASVLRSEVSPPPSPSPYTPSVPLRPGPQREEVLPAADLPPIRVVIPSIELEAPVVKARVADESWEVPKFVAGHLLGSDNPGLRGNVALSGHLESIASGDVFARLKEVALEDRVFLMTARETFVYEVVEVKTVEKEELEAVRSTAEPTVTLITCTGRWLPLQRDYTHRLIVVGRLLPPERLP